MSATNGVTVVIPWAGSCPYRVRARDWLRSWYSNNFPDWECVIARGRADPWCKARAVMPAVEQSRSDTVVLSDADVFCPNVGKALESVIRGAAWAVPHNRVVRLDERATEQLLAGADAGSSYAEPPYAPMIGGGLLVARRDVLLEAPLDGRFVGWGQEDECHGRALRCIFGEAWQGRGELVHLWHPPQARKSRSIGSDESWALRRRYRRARSDPAAMRALLEEAR